MDKDADEKRTGKLGAELLNLFKEAKDNTQPKSTTPIRRQTGKEKESTTPIRRQTGKEKEFKKYESLKIFKETVQLLFVDDTKCLRFNDKAVAELQKVTHDVNVVAVVGLYRTGKSLLLNRLAGKNNAFDIGDTCNAKTMGVWIKCLPHPTQESQVLVLLDTEGLGAVQQDKLLEDRWHFLLATLLSSTLVYNLKGVLDADAIQKLAFLKDIKSSLRTRSTDTEDDSYFDLFFPSFIMVLRDISVKIADKAENPITTDQYLENALGLMQGDSDDIRKYNMPRQLIRKYFKDRRCFKFSIPKNPDILSKGEMRPNTFFEDEVRDFKKHIYQCKPKRMTSGKPLNGRMFGSIIISYVRFIQEGKPPCMYTAVKEMIKYENQNLVLAAQDVYKTEMHCLLGEELPEIEVMAQFHVQSTDKAIEYLRNGIIYDDVDIFTGTATEAFEQVLDRLIKSVTKDSEKICWGRLQYLDRQRIQIKINLKTYENISGYDEYIKDVEWIIKHYNNTPGLGPKKSQVLQSYLDGKEEEEKKIFRMVQEAQTAKSVQYPKPHIEATHRSFLRQLSKEVAGECEFMTMIREDQSIKRKELRENLQNISNKKIKEYERQVHEGFESAADTDQENKRFIETFLSNERAEPEGVSDTSTDDQKKYPAYDPPWTSHLELSDEAGSRAPGHAKVPEPRGSSGATGKYHDFVDNPPKRKKRPCKIM